MAASSPYGPNLVLNGTFDGNDATGWTLNRTSISGNALQMVNASGFAGFSRYTFAALEDGATYQIDFDVTTWTARGGLSHSLALGGTSTDIHALLGAAGPVSFQAVAGATTETMQITCQNGDDFVLDNFQVRKVL